MLVGRKQGLYALVLCILDKKYTPSQAVSYISTGRKGHGTEEMIADTKTMLYLRRRRQSYKQIAKIFDISANTVYRRIDRYLKKEE